MFDTTVNTKTQVTLIDRHCGYGKTSRLLKSFRDDQQILVVTPLLSEVQRVIDDSTVDFYQPLDAQDPSGTHATKKEHLRELLTDGRNVACSHKLFTDIASLAREGLLAQYDVYVDEVLTVAETVTKEVEKPRAGQVNATAWKRVYIDKGFATIDPLTKEVIPTKDWSDDPEGLQGTLSLTLYRMAEAGCLFAIDDNVLVWELPPVLMTAPKSLTVMTYQAEGSMMAAFLRKHRVAYSHDLDREIDREFRETAKKLITIKDIPSLKDITFSYSSQQDGNRKRSPANDRKVATALKKIRERELTDVPRSNVMVTCAKQRWFDGSKGPQDTADPKPGTFASGSRLFEDTHWVPNTTRGTNNYRHCTHLIYLWNQSMNPRLADFLHVNDREHQELYAVSELIQWVYRSRVRDGMPITLYLPSKRMRTLLNKWLNGEI